ncbi:extracellular solute-binding protein [Mesorhizobium sp. ORM8.1]
MGRKHCKNLPTKLSLGMLGTLLFVVGGHADETGTGPDGWSQAYKGTHLHIIAEAATNSTVLQDLLADFQKKTGIEVTLEQAPYDILVQKAVLNFATKSGTYDVLSIPYEYLGSFAEQNYIQIEDDFCGAQPKGAPTYRSADIIPVLWKASSQWKEHCYGAPSNSGLMMMFYRKDLFSDPTEQQAFKAKYGYDLAPAKTWQQYKDIAEFFTRKSGDKLAGKELSSPMYGVALAGKRHTATVLEWMNYMWTFGGGLFDSSGNPALNSAANVAALDFEKSLTAYAPPGYTSATWDEVTTQLEQGIAAESITWGDTPGAIEDATQSKVVGKIGYAAIPTKAVGDHPEALLGSWTWTVNADSANKEAAQLFMAWALSKPTQTKLAELGGLPALTSVFKDPELQAKLPYWNQELSSLQQSKARPRIPQWGGINDVLSNHLSQALNGQVSSQAALDDAQNEITKLLNGALPVTYE